MHRMTLKYFFISLTTDLDLLVFANDEEQTVDGKALCKNDNTHL